MAQSSHELINSWKGPRRSNARTEEFTALQKKGGVGVFEKIDHWRTRKADVEDYAEETMPGFRSYLEKANGEEEEISEVEGNHMAISQTLHGRRSEEGGNQCLPP